jgi:hypothetical protein
MEVEVNDQSQTREEASRLTLGQGDTRFVIRDPLGPVPRGLYLQKVPAKSTTTNYPTMCIPRKLENSPAASVAQLIMTCNSKAVVRHGSECYPRAECDM